MTGLPAPMLYRWDAENSVMVTTRPRLADREYVDGETYRLGVIEERSINSHNHYFASIAEAWGNLPDHLIGLYPSPEALRKRALIETGYCDSQSFVCGSKAEALRLASFIRPHDDFAVIIASGATVTRYTAKSQSMKAMGKQAFGESKQKVLDWISGLIGTTTKELEAASG